MGSISRRSLGRVVGVGVTSLAIGCAPPAVVYRPASDAVAAENGGPLELTLTSGEQYIIGSGRVHDDTLYAVRLGADMSRDAQVTVPVRQIVSLKKTRGGLNAAGAGAIGLTVGAIAGTLVVIGLLLAVAGT
jgi:hypothetical protein